MRLKNFNLFRDEVVLDLRADSIKTARTKMLTNNVFEALKHTVLKSIAITLQMLWVNQIS